MLGVKSNQVETNTKKVWVNAQVTGTIAFIEMILTILYVVMVAYYGSTHFTNLLIVMALYDVILPYAFLMNTSVSYTHLRAHET